MGQNHKRAPDASNISIQIFGGMGDVLAITPALKALKQQEPNRKIVVYFVGEDHRRLLENNPHIDKYKKVLTAPSWLRRHQLPYRVFRAIQLRVQNLTDPHRVRLSVGSMGTYTVYRIKAARILAQGLDVDLVDDQPEIYLTNEELDSGKKLASKFTNPVILNPTSRSRSNSVWPLVRWQQLIKSFPKLTFVQVGLPDEPLITGAVDLRKNNSLRELIALLKYARCYVGMDTFWGHAAAAVNTRGVVLHGDGHPAVFGHDCHINLFKNFRCAPCMPRLGMSPCPYDVECIKAISVEDVAKALIQQLNAGTPVRP